MVTLPATLPQAAETIRARECAASKVFRVLVVPVALALVGHLVVLLWAQHDFTPVEALVVLHSNMLAHGGGLYWGLNRYPFTISPYGPVFYAVSGYLHRGGVPAYQAGRILSFAALVATLWLLWRSLGFLVRNRYARATGVVLAASTSNVLFWGTTGQVDLLACCFSFAAFATFLGFRERRGNLALALSGVFVILAVFTKQTFLAAGAAIGITLLWEDRKRAAVWIPSVALAGGGIAFALNAATHGGYFADAIFANINPFALFKLREHVQYLILTGAGMLLPVLLGISKVARRSLALCLYAALSVCIWLVTAPKIGSDLNYQVEMVLVLAMCAAVALDQVEFFPSVFENRRTWVTLLQAPLLLHVVLNIVLSARVIAERAILDPFKGRETLALKPFVDRPGRLLSVQYDSQVHYRGNIEVEPLIYFILVRAGLTDPAPVLRDLETRQFGTVMLAQNAFEPLPSAEDQELGRLPAAQMEAIRRNYRLVQQVNGSLYIYEPRRD